jgi:hypothetical protein
MMVLQIIVEAVGQVIGGLVAATLLCWLSWNTFRLVRHPEMSAVLVLAILLVIRGLGLASPLLNLKAAYAGLFAVWLWPAGLAWRRQRSLDQGA